MTNIAEQLVYYNEKIVAYHQAKLVAVSKTKPIEDIQIAYDAGQRIFGENKVQELVDKHEVLPQDISWHMIGHLQRNKVKYIAPFVDLIHAVDTTKLVLEIEKQAQKNKRVIPCLFQLHIAQETTKFGFSEDELIAFLESEEFKNLKHVKIVGLMGMATNTTNTHQVQQEFSYLKKVLTRLKSDFNLPHTDWKELSMGMSGDFEIALKEGATMIRIGSAIFGARNYQK